MDVPDSTTAPRLGCAELKTQYAKSGVQTHQTTKSSPRAAGRVRYRTMGSVGSRPQKKTGRQTRRQSSRSDRTSRPLTYGWPPTVTAVQQLKWGVAMTHRLEGFRRIVFVVSCPNVPKPVITRRHVAVYVGRGGGDKEEDVFRLVSSPRMAQVPGTPMVNILMRVHIGSARRARRRELVVLYRPHPETSSLAYRSTVLTVGHAGRQPQLTHAMRLQLPVLFDRVYGTPLAPMWYSSRMEYYAEWKTTPQNDTRLWHYQLYYGFRATRPLRLVRSYSLKVTEAADAVHVSTSFVAPVPTAGSRMLFVGLFAGVPADGNDGIRAMGSSPLIPIAVRPSTLITMPPIVWVLLAVLGTALILFVRRPWGKGGTQWLRVLGRRYAMTSQRRRQREFDTPAPSKTEPMRPTRRHRLLVHRRTIRPATSTDVP